MSLDLKLILFILASLPILWVSRGALRNPQHHGFYRFFAWETILAMFLLNVDHWFASPFSLPQIFSWIFLILSLGLIYSGVQSFRHKGSIDPGRQDAALVGIEKTTTLVTTGIYHFIRHPFYSSLLFLCWGIFLKDASLTGLVLALTATVFLTITARKEEGENIQFFGEAYRTYMHQTKMFIPYIF